MYISTKFTYNVYIGPYFLSLVVFKIFTSAPLPWETIQQGYSCEVHLK